MTPSVVCIELCSEFRFSMETNGTFNFSLDEAYKILVEHSRRNTNVDKITENVLIAVYSLLIMLGLFANLVVSFVVARRPQMHTARNLFIVNLTLSDMTLCVICMPFTLLKIIRREWSMGELLCKLVPVLQGTNILVSVGTITIIALDRYFTIVHAHDGTSRTRVVCSIVCVWLLSLIATLPIFFYQVVEPFKFQEVVFYEICIESWPSQQLKVMYSAAILLVQAVIPVMVVGGVHASISSHLHAHAKTQRDSRRAQRELARNKRTTLLLSVVAILFAISWLPLGIFSLVSEVVAPPDSSQSLYLTLAVCHVIAMSSAVSNPVMYGWMNSNIRQELMQLLPFKRRRPVVEEATTRTALHTNCRKESVTLLVHNGDKQPPPSNTVLTEV
ncbi:neuropeptide F receptor-like [Homalodisca vitripennis]|uniref:neuropeptide F receptor-like n=1 Tax=Homalodisca vitripennis TaxID=197043 RepID=UPI001EEB6E95|nr:neuropeptide F receptor-like [Homalodisca vitripennis]